MNYLSVCSGIEAATCAWHPLGWKPVAFSEIEKFPSAVLAYHYPHVPNLGDMTKFKEWPDYADVDVLVGGTPCQSFSVAGLRKGLDDPRGNLMLTYACIARRYSPCWLVWENVPGVLSSNGGRDFGSLLGLLAGKHIEVPKDGWKKFGFVSGIKGAYGLAWRVLDAQYFGVAQRRRRVFVVGYLGDWRRAAAVLLERESLSGNPAPRREKGEIIAALTANGVGTCGADDNQGQVGHLIAHRMVAFGEYADDETASAMKARDHKDATDLVVQSQYGDIAGTLAARHDPSPCADRGMNVVGFDCKAGGNTSFSVTDNKTGTMRGEGHGGGHLAVMSGIIVRRLTPRECEKLQGFPVDYTLIPEYARPSNKDDRDEVARWIMRGNPDMSFDEALQYADHPDGPRYKALGNSMAVPVMRWIGERIIAVDELSKKKGVWIENT